MVMAFAANEGGLVYTHDIDALERLDPYFPAVRVLGI